MAIAGLVQDCLEAFSEDLLIETADRSIPDRINDGLGRFRIWAGNVSAHTTGRRSLQYRLRDSSQLTATVVKYLRDLLKILKSVPMLLANESNAGPYMDDDNDDLSSEDDEDGFPPDDPMSRLDCALEDINQLVTCLFRISAALRNPARHDEVRYADSLGVAKFYEPRDIEHTREKFPEASRYLVERLGKAISRHRQYFKYREEHHNKLAVGLDGEAYDPAEIASTVATSLPASNQAHTRRPLWGSDAESVYSDTSYATTVTGDSHLRPPPLPDAGEDGKPFECMICYGIVIAEDERIWRQHVYEDLPPYVCTDRHCKTGNRQYSRRRDWQQHMRSHDRYWICPYGCTHNFRSVPDLGEHLRSQHGQNLDGNTLHSIANSCCQNKQNEGDPQSCPLCFDSRPNIKLWYKHVGHHMEQLALFALPQHILDHESDEEGSHDHNSEDDAGIDSTGDERNAGFAREDWESPQDTERSDQKNKRAFEAWQNMQDTSRASSTSGFKTSGSKTSGFNPNIPGSDERAAPQSSTSYSSQRAETPNPDATMSSLPSLPFTSKPSTIRAGSSSKQYGYPREYRPEDFMVHTGYSDGSNLPGQWSESGSVSSDSASAVNRDRRRRSRARRQASEDYGNVTGSVHPSDCGCGTCISQKSHQSSQKVPGNTARGGETSQGSSTSGPKIRSKSMLELLGIKPETED